MIALLAVDLAVLGTRMAAEAVCDGAVGLSARRGKAAGEGLVDGVTSALERKAAAVADAMGGLIGGVMAPTQAGPSAKA